MFSEVTVNVTIVIVVQRGQCQKPLSITKNKNTKRYAF